MRLTVQTPDGPHMYDVEDTILEDLWSQFVRHALGTIDAMPMGRSSVKVVLRAGMMHWKIKNPSPDKVNDIEFVMSMGHDLILKWLKENGLTAPGKQILTENTITPTGVLISPEGATSHNEGIDT